MSKLSKSLSTLFGRPGQFKTVADRMKIADRMAERMLNLNIQIRDVRHIKTHHVELYIRSRLAESISKRTLQNEMAALRAIFNVAGRSKLADPAHECLSNSALGLSGASRDGTKVAISDERYQAVFSVIKIKDEGVAAAVQLSRCLGVKNGRGRAVSQVIAYLGSRPYYAAMSAYELFLAPKAASPEIRRLSIVRKRFRP